MFHHSNPNVSFGSTAKFDPTTQLTTQWVVDAFAQCFADHRRTSRDYQGGKKQYEI
jgi:hypothetical protein